MRSLLIVPLLVLAGCGPQKEPPDAVIGVSVLTMTNPFFVDIIDAMKEEAANHNIEILEMAGEFNVTTQKDQVKDFIVKKVDAIVLCPCDSKAIGTAIAEANQAGIPVFTADIACLAEGVDVVCHVATDNLGGGRLAATQLAEVLEGEGNVAIIDHPEIESVILRTRGFKERIVDWPDIKVVAVVAGGAKKMPASNAMEALMESHPELDGIFAINDPTALGAIAAMEKSGTADQVKVVSFDAAKEARQAVKDGKIYATMTQYPRKIGKLTVDVVVRYLNGEQVEEEILIPCTAYKMADALADPSLGGGDDTNGNAAP
jgi:ribose transport system substrate-binding protein